MRTICIILFLAITLLSCDNTIEESNDTDTRNKNSTITNNPNNHSTHSNNDNNSDDNNSDDNIYVQSVTLNEQDYDVAWISHFDIIGGGELVFEMGPEPNKDWGRNSKFPF